MGGGCRARAAALRHLRPLRQELQDTRRALTISWCTCRGHRARMHYQQPVIPIVKPPADVFASLNGKAASISCRCWPTVA